MNGYAHRATWPSQLPPPMREAAAAFSRSLLQRSRSLVSFFHVRMQTLITAWVCAIVVLGAAKVALAPHGPRTLLEAAEMLLPFLLVALSPIAGYRIAAGSFPRGLLAAQPAVRLARIGKWHPIDTLAARENAAFGPFGFMASLLVGLLLNVPVRTAEYLMAVPALRDDAPEWANRLLVIATVDVVVMNFFYMVCFVMALRAIPLFPRMLLFAWTVDIALQFAIARHAAGSDLPVPVIGALQSLIEGNIQKVLISAFVWLPYLILSDRVNVTFRQRMRLTAS
ncbi:hypothetical protein GCM10023306_04650 [Novosphingobium ginsenosidimutans]